MKRLAIIGSGDLGQLIAHHAQSDKQFRVVGFFDDFQTKGELVGLAPVLGGIAEVRAQYEAGGFDELMIGIGYKHPQFRSRCFEEFSGVVPLARLVHSSCILDPSVVVGPGAFLLPGCVLDKGVVIEENVLLNTACVIAHDTRVKQHTFLGPGVAVAGFVTIGASCFLGVGTVIVDNVSICPGVQTGGGAVVVKDLVQAGLYVGVPACKIK